MTFPESVLKVPLGPSQVEQLASFVRHRLPLDREEALMNDPVALNNYSKVVFGGGQLPGDMHNRMHGHAIEYPSSESVKDYFRRLEAAKTKVSAP